jgi:thymidylate synthase (FAD)
MLNKNTYFRVLDKGFVGIVDWMGDDQAIEQAARVSYQKGTRPISDTRALIRYLIRHNHGTPLEMGEMKFHIRIPMDAHRQLVRHRTASINEYSTRYSEAIDECQTTNPKEWRGQSTTNKQGSEGGVAWPTENDIKYNALKETYGNDVGEYLSDQEAYIQRKSRVMYEERLKFGVAREQARKDLPLSTYTELYWKMDVRNLLHFLYLRCDEHAQLEIRSYANVIAAIVKEVFPLTFEAFHDYKMDIVTFTRAEWDTIRDSFSDCDGALNLDNVAHFAQNHGLTNKRELQELKAKLTKFDTPPKTFDLADFEQVVPS